MLSININKKLHGSQGDMELDVNLEIKEGEFLAVSGKSGSGKTTLLRILAGLEESKGRIKFSNKIWQDETNFLVSQKRKIGFVFQEYALFENMSVRDNLLYVKRDKKLCTKLLEMTELSELKDKMPNTLSGGQKQRVSLCRAMMQKPKLLLMDEPLSALDTQIRKKLQQEILALHREFEMTTIMVSHEPSEIYRLASRVVILDQGKLINDGTPKDILLRQSGSQKFSFEGELLEIVKVDVIFIAVIAIGQQVVEVVVSLDEVRNLKTGQKITVSTKAFAPVITI